MKLNMTEQEALELWLRTRGGSGLVECWRDDRVGMGGRRHRGRRIASGVAVLALAALLAVGAWVDAAWGSELSVDVGVVVIEPNPVVVDPYGVRGCSRAETTIGQRSCIVRRVFGVDGRRHGRDAVRVAWCESRLDPRASNGQYLGILQMGRRERAIYGHGSTVLAQAIAARRYWRASGRDWSPWECKP